MHWCGTVQKPWSNYSVEIDITVHRISLLLLLLFDVFYQKVFPSRQYVVYAAALTSDNFPCD